MGAYSKKGLIRGGLIRGLTVSAKVCMTLPTDMQQMSRDNVVWFSQASIFTRLEQLLLDIESSLVPE